MLFCQVIFDPGSILARLQANDCVQSINARVNAGSVDNSTNTANINEVVGEQLESLRKEIANLSLSPTAQVETLDVLDAVEEQFTQGYLQSKFRIIPRSSNKTG